MDDQVTVSCEEGNDRFLDLETLAGIKGLDSTINGDELNAVICALVEIMYLREEHSIIGDPDEMLMILPQ